MVSIAKYPDADYWGPTRTLKEEFPHYTHKQLYLVRLLRQVSELTVINAVHELEEVNDTNPRRKVILSDIRNKLGPNSDRMLVVYAVLREAEAREIITKDYRWMIEAGWESGFGANTKW